MFHFTEINENARKCRKQIILLVDNNVEMPVARSGEREPIVSILTRTQWWTVAEFDGAKSIGLGKKNGGKQW